MRVIAGALKGRKLSFPKTREIRPATDRVKETIFNVLGQDLTGLAVLDLFAGVGSLGIEALSRGARRATFAESNPLAADYIEKNLNALGLASRAQILKTSAEKAIQMISGRDEKYDIIFIDPPYSKGFVKNTLLHLDQSDILSPHGWLVIEHIKHETPPAIATASLYRTNKYGVTRLSFYCRVESRGKPQ
ncbi:MAG TPA: 16S rRNA (guanine(966)-N(2))-methyltransferase RsmD [Candidatus Omnitrophota bacterium]|nr:16S rRNA (guanine(966)-N(2))-methyltransferase RsmD [Candidatus Omnitrophota bacterium]